MLKRSSSRLTDKACPVDNERIQDSAERALNKLARTFAIQMEALKRYRTGVARSFDLFNQ